MKTSQLRSYAPQAREAFIAAVSAQAARLGVSAKGCEAAKVKGDVLLVCGQAFPSAYADPRMKLVERVQACGFDQVMEAAAYTWFNRLAAIRYMELHGYFDHGYRVLSDPQGETRPELLDHATEVDLPGLDPDTVVALKLDGTQDEELYRLLLKAQCNALHPVFPFLFEKLGAEDELLLPANLLHTDSLIRELVESVDESAWEQIEVIGWLYQFYISEKKDQVMGKVVKSEDIPAATQLFTPSWIVKYMVQNSLGAQWLATYPDSPLKARMEYYFEPAEQTEGVQAQLEATTPEALNPEALTFIDPACGSGHILVEAYDLFKAIYLERGYRLRDVPKLILEKNLFGLDIDPRAAQLSVFALLMKAYADDRRLFERGVKLNVMALVDSAGFNADALAKGADLARHGLEPRDLTELKALFGGATTHGSLIEVPERLAPKLPALRALCDATEQDMFVDTLLAQLRPLVRQAELLAAQFDAVVANPPYMGNRYQGPELKAFLRGSYGDVKTDLFSAFVVRCASFGSRTAHFGIMSPNVWMYLSTHEPMRKHLLSQRTLTSLVELPLTGFTGATVQICAYTFRGECVPGTRAPFIRLVGFKGGDAEMAARTRQAAQDRACGWVFEPAQRDFSRLPGTPLAYWASPALLEAFEAKDTIGSTTDFTASQNKTADNERFLRRFWEVDVSTLTQRWRGYSKGGKFRRWYGNLEYVVDWSPAARAYYADNKSSNLLAEPYRFREGITYSDITSGSYSARYLPEGLLYDMKGPTFHPTAAPLSQILAVINSPVGNYTFKILNPTVTLQAREVRSFPLLPISKAEAVQTDGRVDAMIRLSRSDWDLHEGSWDFAQSPLVAAGGSTLRESFQAHRDRQRQAIEELRRLEEENGELFVRTYGLGDVLQATVPLARVSLTANPAYRYGGKLSEEDQRARFRADTLRELISYAVGCMLGRYSLDEPGLIYAGSGGRGFDPSRYRTFPADEDGLVPLTDTEWFDDDACDRLVEFIAVAWDKTHLEADLAFLAEALSPKKSEASRDALRRYLCSSFFKDHLKTYKKRPIYWLFSSGKTKAFQCLVYLHRYNEGTLARMRSEYVIPLQGKMAARIDKLAGDILVATSTAHRKRLEKQRARLEKQQTELIGFDERLRHCADKRIALDLNVGVKANYGKFGGLLAEVKAVHGEAPSKDQKHRLAEAGRRWLKESGEPQ